MPEEPGFDLFKSLTDTKKEREKNVNHEVLDEPGDGSVVIETTGNDIIGVSSAKALNYDITYKDENDLIKRYRNMSMQPETEDAIDEILSDAIVPDEGSSPVQLNLERTKWKDSARKKINEEFENVLDLLDFNRNGYEIFKRWYIDGRLSFQKIPYKNKKKGLAKLKYLDALNIRKVKEVIYNDQIGQSGIRTIKEVREYYVYTPIENNKKRSSANLMNRSVVGVKISPENIAHSTSGIFDPEKQINLSHLHKAIKPLNQLIMLEDSVVIYRISRAPERRVFYIDVGNLPKTKAEGYLQGIMNRFKNKLVYDAGTGDIKNNKKFQAMTEDYWLPRREGKSGTQIETLQGAQNLGEIEDVEYFRKKLYKSLYIPLSRMEQDRTFSLGRSNEIARDEVRFGKFVSRLRRRFAQLFNDILRTQLIMKGIVSTDEWEENEKKIDYEYQNNTYLAELKEMELQQQRFELAQNAESFVGEYFSREWMRRNIFQLSDQEIDELEKQIKKEKESGEIDDEDMGDAGEFDGSPDPNDTPPPKPAPEPEPKNDDDDQKDESLSISKMREKLNILREQNNES